MENFQEVRLQVEFSDVVEGLPVPETFPAGAILIEQNGEVPWVGVVASGIVRLSMIDARRADQLLGLRSRGWWLNPEAVVLPLPSGMRVTALTEVEMIRLPRERFARLLDDRLLLALQVLQSQLTEKLLARIGLSGSASFRLVRPQGSRRSARRSEDEADTALP